MTFVSDGGVYQEAQVKAMVDPFLAANPGVTIAQDGPTDFAKISQMVTAGNVTWDAVDSDPFFPLGNCGTEAQKLDFNIIDKTDLIQEMVSPCAVPNMIYSDVVVYNSDKYAANPPKTIADFFDTKNFPGKRAIQNAAQGGAYELALLADGVAPADLYPLDYKRALAKLDTLGPDLVFWDSGSQSQEMMEKGEVDMIVAWNGRAYNAAKNGAKIAPMWAQNILAYDVFMVPVGAPNTELAMQFINYAVGPEAQGALQSAIPYAAINTKAPASTGDALFQTWLPTTHVAEGIVQDQAWWAANQDEATKAWNAWTAG
jgi:putative spermidine/putrescine transport system substrate-binding protein